MNYLILFTIIVFESTGCSNSQNSILGTGDCMPIQPSRQNNVESPQFKDIEFGKVTLIFNTEEDVRISTPSNRLTAKNCHLETSINRILEKHHATMVTDYSGGSPKADKNALSSFSISFNSEEDANAAVKEFLSLQGVRAVYRTPILRPG